ncbi:hypothetical protein WN55_05523 [Dufourea novaeangliae]|uniref:Uncharacterized protein n=1 Tax=Dufourea novaeangliae TaxID=178035 RepID=A0A154PPY5_DUFNO|nr:hypothetical protein WN55_05523 [Dufourea novaeangliae]
MLPEKDEERGARLPEVEKWESVTKKTRRKDVRRRHSRANVSAGWPSVGSGTPYPTKRSKITSWENRRVPWNYDAYGVPIKSGDRAWNLVFGMVGGVGIEYLIRNQLLVASQLLAPTTGLASVTAATLGVGGRRSLLFGATGDAIVLLKQVYMIFSKVQDGMLPWSSLGGAMTIAMQSVTLDMTTGILCVVVAVAQLAVRTGLKTAKFQAGMASKSERQPDGTKTYVEDFFGSFHNFAINVLCSASVLASPSSLVSIAIAWIGNCARRGEINRECMKDAFEAYAGVPIALAIISEGLVSLSRSNGRERHSMDLFTLALGVPGFIAGLFGCMYWAKNPTVAHAITDVWNNLKSFVGFVWRYAKDSICSVASYIGGSIGEGVMAKLVDSLPNWCKTKTDNLVMEEHFAMARAEPKEINKCTPLETGNLNYVLAYRVPGGLLDTLFTKLACLHPANKAVSGPYVDLEPDALVSFLKPQGLADEEWLLYQWLVWFHYETGTLIGGQTELLSLEYHLPARVLNCCGHKWRQVDGTPTLDPAISRARKFCGGSVRLYRDADEHDPAFRQSAVRFTCVIGLNRGLDSSDQWTHAAWWGGLNVYYTINNNIYLGTVGGYCHCSVSIATDRGDTCPMMFAPCDHHESSWTITECPISDPSKYLRSASLSNELTGKLNKVLNSWYDENPWRRTLSSGKEVSKVKRSWMPNICSWRTINNDYVHHSESILQDAVRAVKNIIGFRDISYSVRRDFAITRGLTGEFDKTPMHDGCPAHFSLVARNSCKEDFQNVGLDAEELCRGRLIRQT